MAHPVAQAGRETHERESEAEQLFGLRWLSRPAEHVELGHWAGSSRASGDGKMDKRDVQQTGERRCDWEPRAVHFFASSSLTCQLARLLQVPRSVVAQGLEFCWAFVMAFVHGTPQAAAQQLAIKHFVTCRAKQPHLHRDGDNWSLQVHAPSSSGERGPLLTGRCRTGPPAVAASWCALGRGLALALCLPPFAPT